MNFPRREEETFCCFISGSCEFFKLRNEFISTRLKDFISLSLHVEKYQNCCQSFYSFTFLYSDTAPLQLRDICDAIRVKKKVEVSRYSHRDHSVYVDSTSDTYRMTKAQVLVSYISQRILCFFELRGNRGTFRLSQLSVAFYFISTRTHETSSK